jgi:hypothetical protein
MWKDTVPILRKPNAVLPIHKYDKTMTAVGVTHKIRKDYFKRMAQYSVPFYVDIPKFSKQ